MSRSRKRTPIFGMSGAPSEKRDKRLHNRRYRRACELALVRCPAPELLPHPRERTNWAAMAKDGKAWLDTRGRPELMRK